MCQEMFNIFVNCQGPKSTYFWFFGIMSCCNLIHISMWTISRKGDRENCNDWRLLIFCESLRHLLVIGLRNGFEGTSRSLLETTKIRMEGSHKLSTKMSSLQEWITNNFNTKKFKLSTYFPIFFLTIFLIQYKISDTTCSEPPSILQSWWWQVIELHFTKHVSDAKHARQG